MTTFLKSAFLVIVLVPALAAAQEGQPPDQGGPPPGSRPDATFFRAQAMRALNEKVDILMEQGKSDAAIAELRRVDTFDIPRENPAFELKIRLLGKLAGLYATAGHKEEALATIKRVLAEAPAGSPAEAAAWLDAGTVYRTLGMADDALKAFDRAIDLSNALARSGWRPHEGQPARRPRGGGPPERSQPTPQRP